MTTAHHFTPEPVKTYKTVANAIKAVEKVFGANHEHFGSADTRYIVVPHTDGRFFPLFFGQSALEHLAHHEFNVVA